jgi:UDP-3-O-[3-hydroxymyristoyl] glucosamine N-acyltransferase
MVRASDIASFLNVPLQGADINVMGPRSIASADSGSIAFLSRDDATAIAALNGIGTVLCLTNLELAPKLTCSVLPVENPRLAFCKALNEFFAEIAPTAVTREASIAASAVLGDNVRIEQGACIGEGVRIGDGSHIGANVVVEARTEIGCGCTIKPNSTIGARGFGFARDHDGTPISFPHIGVVRIGDHVEIGANCTVVRAALDATTIEDHVKMDDHVHIAHNVSIGARTFLAAGAIVSGSVDIGVDVWVGPNATIIDYVSIGDGARVGIGSVVMRAVEPGVTVLGNPARRIPGNKV